MYDRCITGSRSRRPARVHASLPLSVRTSEAHTRSNRAGSPPFSQLGARGCALTICGRRGLNASDDNAPAAACTAAGAAPPPTAAIWAAAAAAAGRPIRSLFHVDRVQDRHVKVVVNLSGRDALVIEANHRLADLRGLGARADVAEDDEPEEGDDGDEGDAQVLRHHRERQALHRRPQQPVLPQQVALGVRTKRSFYCKR